jgi:hypothetical protein
MSPLELILFLGMTAPQGQPASVSQAGDQNVVPQIFTAETLKQTERHAYQQALASAFGRRPVEQHSLKQNERHTYEHFQQYSLENSFIYPGSPACFAIRSYIFNHEDGNAPVLVSTTTCTPSDTLRSLEVVSPAKIVPAH